MKGTSAHVALELTHVEPVDQRSGTRKADGVWHFWERAGQRHDALKRVAQTPECRLLFLVGVKHVLESPERSLIYLILEVRVFALEFITRHTR